MTIELDNIIIESELDLPYLSELVDHFKSNERRILDFFGIDKLNPKYKVVFMPFEEFKNRAVSKFGEYKNYIRAFTDKKTDTIGMLSIEDQRKYTTHKTATIQTIKKTIIHEFVHACHNQLNTDNCGVIWFRDGLAVNIANQEYKINNLNECDFEKLRSEFYNYENNYAYAYLIVYYMLNNYQKEEIDRFIRDSDYLRSRSIDIFNEAKKYYNKNGFNIN